MIELVAGHWRLVLEPRLGGSIFALNCAGVPILRTMDEQAHHPLQSACFPLVPYCNRIANGRFAVGGSESSIAPNLPSERHPLHGTGWLRPWQIRHLKRSSALLEDNYRADDGDWPWPYLAQQHVELDPLGVTIRLMAENRAAVIAPLGLGLHPYFRRRPETKVAFYATAMLGVDGDFLPDGTVHCADSLAPFSPGAELPPVLVDNCFTGWNGFASIWDELGTIYVRGFGTPFLHVFAPPNGIELCLEPVNHSPDALNRVPKTVTMLPPGAAVSVGMRIEVNTISEL